MLWQISSSRVETSLPLYPTWELSGYGDFEPLSENGASWLYPPFYYQCHKVVFRSLLQWRKHEALNPGPMLDMFEDTSDGLFDNCLPQGSKDLRPFFPQPAHRRKAGKIREDQREFWPLKERPTNVVTRLVIRLTTGSMWRGPRTYDGTLNYSLLYMTVIALAPHRDIDFA
jgi:hypothetical protein